MNFCTFHRLKNTALVGCITLLFTLTLIGCAPIATTSTPRISESPSNTETDISPKKLARQYRNLADKAAYPDKQYYLLRAAEALIETDVETAEIIFQELDRKALEKTYYPRADLISAQIALFHEQFPLTLQHLPKDFSPLSKKFKARALKTRAHALNELGYPAESVASYIELDNLISNQTIKNAIHHVIWTTLDDLSESDLDTILEQPLNGIYKGWVRLTLDIKRMSSTQRNLDETLQYWEMRFPSHPANNGFFEILKASFSATPKHPNHIALLLPLTGKYAKIANAIRDGFMASYYNSDFQNKPRISIYDIGDNPDDIWLHQLKAEQAGAELIVGPLDKRAISSLITAPKLKTPVLGLNYATDSEAHSKRVFQFGLLPEDEARQAAELAIIRGQYNASILTPDTALGRRLRDAFAERFTSLSGTILNAESYSANATDHKTPIQRLLNILQSKNRNAILRSVIQRSVKFEPRKRQDIDVIFLAANPKQARQIKPQLKFFDADDIPVYTTSQIFSGKTAPKSNNDLNGLIYTDIPWLLKNTTDPDFKTLLDNWPNGMQRYPRFYALGLDAYRIIPHLRRLKQYPHERFNGATGNISIDENNRIRRESVWAMFVKGNPEKLEFSLLENELEINLEENQ